MCLCVCVPVSLSASIPLEPLDRSSPSFYAHPMAVTRTSRLAVWRISTLGRSLMSIMGVRKGRPGGGQPPPLNPFSAKDQISGGT